MPIYEYRCNDCNKLFEYQQRMSEDAKTECEACSGQLERLISATAFHLKGGGWYKDLYSSTKPENKTENKTENKAESKAESGAASSSESSGSSNSGDSKGSSSSDSSSSSGNSSSSESSPKPAKSTSTDS